jgi:putative oxidoreductase
LEDRPSPVLGILRIVVGLVFAADGLQRLARHSQAVHDFQHWGLPAPAALSLVVGLVEVVCGAILALGLLPRLAALVLLFVAGGAVLTAGRVAGGRELVVSALLAVLLCILIIGGGGRWALVDRLDPEPQRRLVRST